MAMLKQAIEIVASDRSVRRPVLKKESGQGGLHQPVLIPLGVEPNELAHGLKKILGHLVFNAHAGKGVAGNGDGRF